MKIFSFTGWSGSGKTTLISELIIEFRKRGYRVMAVKNAPHKHHLEPEGKDSQKFLESGAEEVYLLSKGVLMNMRPVLNEEDFFNYALPEMEKYDFVLLEGIKKNGIPVFEIFNSRLENKLRTEISILSGIFSDIKVHPEIPYINRGKIIEIADFLEKFH
ncbi:MAG: molybdopterin-guanine dinucleotide biosynthesis protein B [Acidobacteriota bacterium]